MFSRGIIKDNYFMINASASPWRGILKSTFTDKILSQKNTFKSAKVAQGLYGKWDLKPN
jgi:hypothetical protein